MLKMDRSLSNPAPLENHFHGNRHRRGITENGVLKGLLFISTQNWSKHVIMHWSVSLPGSYRSNLDEGYSVSFGNPVYILRIESKWTNCGRITRRRFYKCFRNRTGCMFHLQPYKMWLRINRLYKIVSLITTVCSGHIRNCSRDKTRWTICFSIDSDFFSKYAWDIPIVQSAVF